MSEEDPYNLSRFLEAQDRPWQCATIYDQALDELKARAKRTHWIWFVFPQIAGLGHSPTAQFFAISGLNEARAYLEHDRLGPRLVEAAQALLPPDGHTAHQVMGAPDDMKLHSSMTLFTQFETSPACLQDVLAAYFDGKPDLETLARLSL